MTLNDSEIRNNLIKTLELLIVDIRNYELPLSPSNVVDSEYFCKDCNFGKKGVQRMYCRALIAVADDPDIAKRTVVYANERN